MRGYGRKYKKVRKYGKKKRGTDRIKRKQDNIVEETKKSKMERRERKRKRRRRKRKGDRGKQNKWKEEKKKKEVLYVKRKERGG